MSFCFYPKHEYGCKQVGHCPHLGGASLGTLVLLAEENEESREYLYRQLDAERERGHRLFRENEALKEQLAQAKLELKLERQTKFATNQQKQADADSGASTISGQQAKAKKRKRGAPKGHPGWYRRTPTHYNRLVEVPAPARCSHCQGPVSVYESLPKSEHLQEDLIGGRAQVTLYRRPQARCRTCRRSARQAGKGEILDSMIGPHLRAKALYLRHEIGISTRKVPRAIEDLFGFHFTPATLLSFERLLADRVEPVVEDIRNKIASSDEAVHADETYWTCDAKRSYFWLHGTQKHIHFQFDTSRAGEVSREVLGEDFAGTLVTDCYSAYDAQGAKAKQKCLAHLARTARDWQKLTTPGSPEYRFFDAIKSFVKRGCALAHERDTWSRKKQAEETAWLRRKLKRLMSWDLSYDKALTLQERIKRYQDCWLVFLDDPRVPPTNNHAERCLRPLVILRKITFGHRTRAGAVAMARIMTIKETAKRHGRKVLEILYRMWTRPPERLLRYIYAGPGMTGS